MHPRVRVRVLRKKQSFAHTRAINPVPTFPLGFTQNARLRAIKSSPWWIPWALSALNACLCVLRPVAGWMSPPYALIARFVRIRYALTRFARGTTGGYGVGFGITLPLHIFVSNYLLFFKTVDSSIALWGVCVAHLESSISTLALP
mgnify:FL=1